MGLSINTTVTIPDTIDETEVMRIGSVAYPLHGVDGEPETLEQALFWGLASDWGREKLAALGVTVTVAGTTTPQLALTGGLT